MVTQHLLRHFYDHVECLSEHLERILPEHAGDHVKRIFVIEEPGNSTLANALQRLAKSVVCTTSPCGEFEDQRWSHWNVPNSQEAVREANLGELVQLAQRRLLRSGIGSKFASNVLTLGYREADDRMGGMREVRMAGSYAITNYYPNSTVGMIMLGKEWQHLFNQVGSEVMLHLLTQVSIFLPIEESDGNMVQILGPTLAELHPRQAEISKEVCRDKIIGKKRRRKTKRDSNMPNHETSKSQPALVIPRSKTLVSRSKSDSVVKLIKTEIIDKRSRKESITQRRTASLIPLSRNKIFYARPIKNRSGRVALGLPLTHIFNRTANKEVLDKRCRSGSMVAALLTPSKRRTIKCNSKQSKALLERTRKVLKYMWPREYGLSNILTQKEKKGRADLTDYTNREESIKARGAVRMPKRLSNVARLVSIMLQKHDKLDYSKLLHYCCPTSLRSTKLTRAEKEEIIIHLSDTTLNSQVQFPMSQLQTQPAIINPVGSLGFSQHHKSGSATSTQKPAFTKYKMAIGSVSRFAQAVVRHLLPLELLGSHHNVRILLKNIDSFVRLRRHETLNLHHLCQGLRILDCHWLLPRKRRALNQRPTSTEMQKRQSLMYELIYYLFDSIVIPLLRTNFYATESVAYRNQTIYFRQDDWNTITIPILEKLKAGNFTTLSKNEAVSIMSGREFGYSYIRLLPKLNGVRPIVNLRRRSVKIDRDKSESQQIVQQQHSINNILNITFHVLNYEKKSDLSRLGSSVFGAQDIYEKLYNYKKKLMAHNRGVLPRLFFVKVDVACAFDSIDQEKLVEIVQDIVSHDRYIIQKFCQIMGKGDRVSKSWRRYASAEDEVLSSMKAVEESAKELNNVILCDGVVYTHCDRSKLIWLLEEHINNNLIKIGKVFCKQKIGIPQGSTLSTLLCCYYLAKMEAEKGFSLQEDHQYTLLMRYTDDFLFISTSQEKARQFYETIKSGDESYNVRIAVEKSLHNLDMGLADENTRIVTENHLFPWCSYLIDTSNLSVQYDMARYYRANLADTLTINHKSPFQNLSRILQSSIRNQNMCIFLDVSFNGIDVVIGNLYRNFLLAALKMISCYREIRKVYKIKRNDAYIISCINASIGLCYANFHAKVKKSSLNESSLWEIDRATFHLLALHAFARIFSLRPTCKKWMAPLHSQIKSSHQYQTAYENHLQNITYAWQSCKGIIASIKV